MGNKRKKQKKGRSKERKKADEDGGNSEKRMIDWMVQRRVEGMKTKKKNEDWRNGKKGSQR